MTTARSIERLEARITSDQKELFKEAARLRGVTLTDFVINSAYEAAMKTLEASHLIDLGARDRDALVDALLHPKAPTKKLRDAAARHARMARSSKPASR